MRTIILLHLAMATAPVAIGQSPTDHVTAAAGKIRHGRWQLIERGAMRADVRRFHFVHSGDPANDAEAAYSPGTEIFVSIINDGRKTWYQSNGPGLWLETFADFIADKQVGRMVLNDSPPAYTEQRRSLGPFRPPFDSWLGIRWPNGFIPAHKFTRDDRPPLEIAPGKIKSFWACNGTPGYMIHDEAVGYMPVEVQWINQHPDGPYPKNVRIEWEKIGGIWLAKSTDRMLADPGFELATRKVLPPADDPDASLQYATELMKQRNRRSIRVFSYLIGDHCSDGMFARPSVDIRRPVWAAFGLVVPPNRPGSPFALQAPPSPFPTQPTP